MALVAFQCAVNYLYALIMGHTVLKQGEDTTKSSFYACASLTYLLAMATQCSSKGRTPRNLLSTPAPVSLTCSRWPHSAQARGGHHEIFFLRLRQSHLPARDGHTVLKQGEDTTKSSFYACASLTYLL